MYWLGHPSLPLGSVVASYSTTVLIGNPVALRDETTAAASIELDLVCVGVGVGVEWNGCRGWGTSEAPLP